MKSDQPNKKILIVDDDRDIRMLLNRFLAKRGYSICEAGDRKTGLKQLESERPDLIITDFKLPDGDGLELAKQVMAKHSKLPIIMITAYSDVKIAVKAVKRGIFDYITKPLLPDELLETIQRALSLEDDVKQESNSKLEKKNSKARSAISRTDFVVGDSLASKNVMEQISLVAPTDMSVVLLGETGSGKEYAAKEVHSQSKRKDGPFVALDCGALSKEIAGSELFGHVKGAFTGALTDKKGSFEFAEGGTIFLDEIGNLSMDHQVKLLRLLQESKVKRIGSNKELDLDVRVIIATNDDLLSKIDEGEFRQDLWYRLNEFSITLPPLRERKEDIKLFARYFLAQANDSLGRNVSNIDSEASVLLESYSWPGNLRELKNVVKRAVLLSPGDTLKSEVLPPELKIPCAFDMDGANSGNDLKTASLIAEQEMILDALRKTGNNKTKAAEMLRIDRKTLYNKLKQFETDQ